MKLRGNTSRERALAVIFSLFFRSLWIHRAKIWSQWYKCLCQLLQCTWPKMCSYFLVWNKRTVFFSYSLVYTVDAVANLDHTWFLDMYLLSVARGGSSVRSGQGCSVLDTACSRQLQCPAAGHGWPSGKVCVGQGKTLPGGEGRSVRNSPVSPGGRGGGGKGVPGTWEGIPLQPLERTMV